MRFAPALAGLVLVACATVPTQSRFMEEQGVKVTSEALRGRLRAEVIPFTGKMEEAADAARLATDDPAVRRRALVWKINVVPALYRTLFNQRPLVALLDTWALLLQAEAYLRSPQGKASLGPGAEGLLATTLQLEARIQEIATWAAPGRDLAKVRANLQRWADLHPVESTFATRVGVEEYLATVVPTEEVGVLAVAGRIDEDVGGLVARVDLLPSMIPHQAMWQAELTYIDLVDPRMDLALSRGGQALQKIDEMLAWLGTDGLDAFAEEQRLQVVQAVTAQRVEVERLLDRQRVEIQAYVTAERAEIAALVQRERAAVIADAQRVVDHAAEEGARRAKEVVDHALVRAAVLVGGAILATAFLVLMFRRRRAGNP